MFLESIIMDLSMREMSMKSVTQIGVQVIIIRKEHKQEICYYASLK